MLREEKGPALRGTFIRDPVGVWRPARVHDKGSRRNSDEMPRVLPARQTGEQRPLSWPSREAPL